MSRKSKDVPEVMKALNAGQAAIRDLAELDRALRTEHAEALQERNRARSAPPPADEIVENMRRSVDAVAERWAAENLRGILMAFGGGVSEVDGRLRTRKVRMFSVPADHGRLTFNDLAGVAPELVKARLEAVIREAHHNAGPAADERVSAIEAADARILEIEERHTALVEAAGRLTPPVVLTLLPSVVKRREITARQQELQSRGIERRRALEDQVNAKNTPKSTPLLVVDGVPQQQGRTRDSDYLQSGGVRT